MGGSCLSVSPVEIILVLLAGIVLLFHSAHTSISLLLCTLCSSVSLHSTAQLGNVLSGVGHSPVPSSKPGNRCWKEWEKAVVTEVCAEPATLLLEREPCIFSLHFSVLIISSCSLFRVTHAQLLPCVALSCQRLYMPQFWCRIPLFNVRACKGMFFEGGRPVHDRLSESGAVMETLISVRSFAGF